MRLSNFGFRTFGTKTVKQWSKLRAPGTVATEAKRWLSNHVPSKCVILSTPSLGMAWDGVGQVKLAPWVPPKGLQKVEEEQGRKRRNEIKKGCVIMWEISLPLNCTSASKPWNSPTARTVIHQHHILSIKYSPGRKYWTSLISSTQAVEDLLENGPIYIYIYIYIQGVTGGKDHTSGGCSLC